MCKGWFHHPNTHWLTVRLWLNDIGRKGGDRPAGGNRRGSVRGWPGRSILFVGPLLRAHLLTTCQGRRWYCLTAAVRPPGAVPAGRPFPCPVWDRPADANGGLCIGRSFADALGACGSSATNKLCRVYTGALLATTIISVQKQGLNIAYICAILCSYQSDKLEFSSLLIADNSVHKAPFY